VSRTVDTAPRARKRVMVVTRFGAARASLPADRSESGDI
jgi:hypothetical protein